MQLIYFEKQFYNNKTFTVMKKSLFIIASACLVLIVTLASTGTKNTPAIAKQTKFAEVKAEGRMLSDANQFN